jgi:hypothetical protein
MPDAELDAMGACVLTLLAFIVALAMGRGGAIGKRSGFALVCGAREGVGIFLRSSQLMPSSVRTMSVVAIPSRHTS